jgi:hypothetical protein
MQFMIVINQDEKAQAKASDADRQKISAEYMKYTQELKTAGALLGGEALDPSNSAVRVIYKEGRRVLTDGPFTEAKELVGGFYLIDVKSKEEAVEWASRCPGAHHDGVELRTVRMMPKA